MLRPRSTCPNWLPLVVEPWIVKYPRKRLRRHPRRIYRRAFENSTWSVPRFSTRSTHRAPAVTSSRRNIFGRPAWTVHSVPRQMTYLRSEQPSDEILIIIITTIRIMYDRFRSIDKARIRCRFIFYPSTVIIRSEYVQLMDVYFIFFFFPIALVNIIYSDPTAVLYWNVYSEDP